jgi:hypothetical protein
MKTRHVVALSMLSGAALAGFALQAAHAEDKYIKNLPLDALTVPVPVIPQGSTLDLRPNRSLDSTDQMKGFTRDGQDATTPGIGLSIKTSPGR